MIEQEGIKVNTKLLDKETRIMLINISGYVDQANCHILQKTIDQCLKDECYNLIFDFQNLVYMSSAGWGVLIGEIKRFRENGGDIKLANMGPEIYEIYQMLEFYHIISEYPSVEDALKSYDIGADIDQIEKVSYVSQNDNPIIEDNEPTEKEEPTIPLEKNETEPIPETLKPNEEPAAEEVPKQVVEDEIDVNIDDILASEGIERTREFESDPNYVAFDPERYNRKIDPKIMPIPDKIRFIVARHPEFSTWKIKKTLRQPDYGNVKIGFFKLRSLLKELELDTKEKRYRFYRSA